MPRIISAGEALTDMIRQQGNHWISRAGGAPWNVARVMARLSITSAFAGAISRDNFGEELAQLSREAGLDLRFLQQHDKPALFAFVHESSPPQYHFIGNDSADLAFDPAALPAGWTGALEWLHCGGISLTRAPLSGRLVAMAHEAKAAGARISFDPNFRNLMKPAYDTTLAEVARIADVIKVSDEDLRGLFRTQDVAAAMASLKALNPRAAIFLTLGADGAEIHADGKVLRQSSPRIEIVDTVGAGDASIGGLLASLIQHPQDNWSSHLRRAVATGAAACLHAGATPPTPQDVDRVLTQMQ